jgi:acyl-homoserine lactone acylase PvdQ
MRRAVLTALVTLLASAAPAAAQLPPIGGGEQPPGAYGQDDAGGFRNVLPPGSRGLDNLADFTRFQASGERPPHFADQLDMYVDLLYASPTLRAEQLPSFYKDATFGVRPDDVESIVHPRPGTTIVRDKGYGVPHVYGDTRGDVMFGAGYAGAQDRLFLMDVLRHTGRAQLSSFIGGAAANREMDRTQWQLAPYTEADLQRQNDLAEEVYGARGKQVRDDNLEYVAGINQYIAEAQLDPNKKPAEYSLLGIQLEPWKVTDPIATASLVGGIFGKGGGKELRSAQTLQAFLKRFGRRGGRRAWRDFRQKDDPETPNTIRRKRFPYETASAFSKRGLAMPDPGSVTDAPVAPPVEDEGGGAAANPKRVGALGFDPRAILAKKHQSNALLVSAKHSRTGRPIAVMGPQVGYFVPQILMEEELHGPGIDARGTAFPGVNLYVQLGHGRDYAWSATTANSDNIDTFAERLCRDDFHYMWRGRCIAMEKLERTNSWTPNALDPTPPGSETLTAYRTVHGIVFARGTVKGAKVAFTSARSTYFHEADSALGFSALNDPGAVHDARSFQRAASDINFAFNWFYIDAKDIAYYQSGWYPKRARRASPDFPIWGTGQYDWRRFDADLRQEALLPYGAHPNVINQASLVSWNNKQAPGWAAADDNYHYGPIFRSQLLSDPLDRALRRGHKVTLTRLVQIMQEAATRDLRGVKLLPVLLRAVGRPRDPKLASAVNLLRRWHRSGAHRRDLDKDGHYDDDAAVTLMDAWWPLVRKTVFEPRMGEQLYAQMLRMLPPDEPISAVFHQPPYFEADWWGLVSKDLRTVFRRRPPPGSFSKRYCGAGSKRDCRRRLRASLAQALTVPKGAIYEDETCAQQGRVEAACSDETRSTSASGVGIDPFPYLNRPTFQQIVSVPRKLGR